MTLKTEQLRARAKFWREKAVEAKWESVSIAQDMLLNADAFDELADIREAQPLGFIDPGNLRTYRGVMAGGTWSPVRRNLSGLNLTLPIYLAPPAPAVPDEFKLVPIVPTPEMIAAAMNCDDVTFTNPETFCVNFGNIYAAMLAAAPEDK
ncbi:hypothetical protein JY479_01495 [Serratia marcescens]|uniref:hypothetical protein n=1 Tax=Serratia marcescens TaxID=615 RepID=UPI0006651F02|nr:hypothetical protein [Serratia marcescens]MBN5318687.1 hypothetical protein [Serratia marcescens]